MRRRLMLPVLALLAIAPMLAACESFDLDSLDVFGLSDKKKLPGERKALFPEGVPGVSQGIPPDLVKGAQPTQTADVPPETPPPAAQTKPRKPRVARKPTQITVQPQSRQQSQDDGQAPANNAQQPAAAGSFQR